MQTLCVLMLLALTYIVISYYYVYNLFLYMYSSKLIWTETQYIICDRA